jgi:hypothetical protein
VEAEVAMMLGLETVTTTTPGSFAAKQRALSRILERQTDQELAALDAEVQRISQEGNSEETKRRSDIMDADAELIYHRFIHRLAVKNRKKRVLDAMRDQHREMGLASFVFGAHIREDGKLVVDA